MAELILQQGADSYSGGADGHINSGGPTLNYGVSAVFYAGRYDASQIRRGLVKFDLSNLPAGAIVSAATLTLYYETVSSPDTIAAHRALRAWYAGAKDGAAPDAAQDGSTWNFRNANGEVAWGAAGGQSGTDFAAVATASTLCGGAAAAKTWDVTADVIAWAADQTSNHGWLLKNDEVSDTTRVRFTSNEGTAANRPKLTITYTLPSGGILDIGGSGMSGLLEI
jgi:hypothetical protein